MRTIQSLPILGALLLSTAAHATDITAGSLKGEAVLGSAYQSDKQAFPGDKCLKAIPGQAAGTASAGFTFDSSMSESQVSSELGIGAGGRAQAGAVSYSLAANFLQNSVSNDLSVSASWESTYSFPTQKLIATANDLNETGQAVRTNDERWIQTCGDEYVNEITYGGRLFFSVRVDFRSQEDRMDFESKFSVSGSLFSADASLKDASRKFSRSTKVTVSAYQVGGDVSKVTKLFGNEADARKGFVQCQLGDFEKCAGVIEQALDYAANTDTGFPSQLAPGALPGPAVILYRTASYKAIGIYPNNYPGLDDAIRQARQEVSDAFLVNYHYDVSAHRLLQEPGIADRIDAIEAEKAKVEKNITTLLDISDHCYNDPKNCWAYKQQNFVKLIAIDASVFLPPTFQALCRSELTVPALHATFDKIRAQVGSPAGESCEGLEARVKKVSQLDLHGQNHPQDALDLRPLATLRGLEKLQLSGAKIDNLNPLGDLVNLKYLDLSVNHIVSVEPLSDMMDLVVLNLSSNQIQDVSQISGLEQVQRLYLANNKIKDLSSVTFLPQLVNIDLRNNQLSLDQVNKFRAAMPPAAFIQY